MNENNPKGVSFHNIVNIVLIPSREELKEQGGGLETLWRTKSELRKILLHVTFEIRSHAHSENMSLREAAKQLYGLRW